ncbi:anaerobic nitric oxide reductase transcription regulator [Pseudomonas sp. SORGH_AS199]|uniref:Nitric oxide reductase transcriptional regulator NorR n=1 Tax=Pseudomonas flavocrustae TaxID=2991719 RepID=A0ABT6IJU5_9PSED|nr:MULTISPECIES: nitric oxide reductase transcriptional regulator NorR [Pseudomonas]MDH4764733.1 nitric oxide reductase transcriptional regulator NorR [Pseudomonas sp. CBMAI 2609]MDK8266311.1 nitric oxide reductase transcriptional regulator NorR [Pseudomonas oryzihabitans]MDR6228238.1 anaerobic nitric oxide reductase transcription regulator [Pseudomonas sp. SORGH_AS_0199]
MTRTTLLEAMVPLVADLARDLPDQQRYANLLDALRQVLPFDAVALLRLDGEVLVPLAVRGLAADTLGRRFKVGEHPRLALLLASRAPTRFALDCDLPDPYDGLVEGVQGHLEVHDCLGCPLYVQDQLWGLLTLDSLQAQNAQPGDLTTLAAFAGLAAATVAAAERIGQLSARIVSEHELTVAYQQSVGHQRPRELIGQSPASLRLRQEIETVAASDLTVLITGETGVGKELVAEAVHARSLRQQRPLISLNCAALPEALVESELFGHVRGAFSGAISERRGRFELADGGTLFLDEVGELPLTVQAKLLRVLQSGQLQRLGSDRDLKVDVRIIAATNRDLADCVRAGRFRADLYHRLSVYPLAVPAMRERGRDVLLLAGFYLEQNRARLGLRGLRLTPAAQRTLLAYDWPGNVRELSHLISRAALKAHAGSEERGGILTLDSDQLGLPLGSTALPDEDPALPAASLREATEAFQRQTITLALEQHGQNWTLAAAALGLDRANLARLARRLGLK